MKLLFLLMLTIQMSHAEIPNYNPPEILARANVVDGFNIPPMSFLNNASPVINNRGDVAFKIVTVAGVNEQALWIKTLEDTAGKIMYTAPDQRYITEPSLNDEGLIAFSLFDEGVTDGLFVYDSKTFESGQVLNPDSLPIQDYTYPQIQNNENIFFRSTNEANERSYYYFDGDKTVKIISEDEEQSGIKSSFLFRPDANSTGQLAFKARLGKKGKWDESSPDSILLYKPENLDTKTPSTILTIAKDQDADANSKFIKFGNSVSLSTNGTIAFIGVYANNKKTIVLSKDNILTEFAVEDQKEIGEIEMFTPKVNESGLVIFRAKNKEGKRGIYLADGKEVRRIIGEGDALETDLGAGAVLSNPNFPGFGGEVDINDNNEIVFHCLVVSDDNRELGSAIYKITPKKD
jgi:hypothetical protein